MSQQTRSSILPAPRWRATKDFVFVSTLHPVTASGDLVGAVAPSPWTGESAAAAQTRAILDQLSDALAQAESALDLVLRIETQLADAADFVEVKHVLNEYFPTPPAATTIVVGDEHLIAGARVTLQAVALRRSSEYDRVAVTPADVPDPLPAEHAVAAVKAGPFVFCSGALATDFVSGIAVASDPKTYHGSDPALQAEYVIDNLERTLKAGGSALDQLVKVQFYEPDLTTFVPIDDQWGARVGIPPTRSSMACRGLLVPGAVWMVNAMGLVPGFGLDKAETRLGIPWHPVDAGKANFTPGIVAGEWLFTAGQIPVPDIGAGDWVRSPSGLPYHWSDIEIQTDFTLKLLDEQLRANGFSFDDVVDAKVYLVDPRRDFRGFARAWRTRFPDDAAAPALSIIPSTQADGSAGVMVKGPLLEIDFIASKSRSERSALTTTGVES